MAPPPCPAPEATALATKGVAAAIGVSGFPVVNVKAPMQPLIALGVNDAMVSPTFPGAGLGPAVEARWRERASAPSATSAP